MSRSHAGPRNHRAGYGIEAGAHVTIQMGPAAGLSGTVLNVYAATHDANRRAYVRLDRAGHAACVVGDCTCPHLTIPTRSMVRTGPR